MPPNDTLFNAQLWTLALEKYALTTNLTIRLYDTDCRVVFGPIHPTPLFQLFDECNYDPGIFTDCARSCLAQTEDRSALVVSQYHGLAAVGTSLVLSGTVVGAAVGGYVLTDFSQVSEIQILARQAGISFDRVWDITRRQQPVPQSRLTVHGELLQVLGDALLRENLRTRQFEETGSTLATELVDSHRLQEIISHLIQEGDVEQLNQQILDAAVEIMHSDMASMQTAEDNDMLRLRAWRGFGPEFGKLFALNRPDTKTSWSVARRVGHRVVVPDVETCDFIVGTTALEDHRKAGIRAVQSTPLVSRAGRLLGMISNHWREPHQPAERDLRQLDILTRHAADLLERKQAEDVRAKLAAIVESSDDAIIGKDLNGTITTWNRGAERLFGYTEREAVGQPITILMPPERVDEEAVILERIRRGERIEHFETVRRRKDGTLLHVSLSVSPIINAHGKAVGAAKIARDISERKQAEAALRDSEERYRILFELGPVAVYSIDSLGVIQNFNRRAAELWGRAPVKGDTDERFCGSYRLFRPDGSFMPHEQCPMAEVVSGKIPEACDAEVLIERPDGSRVTVIVNIRPLKNERGEIMGAINCFYDISERKRAEEERERLLVSEQAARQQAEAANRVKDQFVAVVSHELRSPVASILMWTNLLKSRSHMDQLPHAMEVIERNARVQLRLVEDLLDLNRVSRGELTLDVGAHDLSAAILLPSLENNRFNAEKNHVVVEFEEATEPLLVEGDAVRLQQIFTNVLSNAVKFTPEGGSIRVTLTGEAESAVVKIRDTGKGIAPEFLPHVFEVFRQQESEIRKSSSGLGIGLALVKYLVELHGGNVQVASEGSGLGTEVTIRLPRLTSKPGTEISKKPAASRVASARTGLLS